jgi:hypothetical protein
VILYGRQKQDLTDRCTILQRCIEEISRIREIDKTENCKFVFRRFIFWKIYVHSKCTENYLIIWW